MEWKLLLSEVGDPSYEWELVKPRFFFCGQQLAGRTPNVPAVGKPVPLQTSAFFPSHLPRLAWEVRGEKCAPLRWSVRFTRQLIRLQLLGGVGLSGATCFHLLSVSAGSPPSTSSCMRLSGSLRLCSEPTHLTFGSPKEKPRGTTVGPTKPVAAHG